MQLLPRRLATQKPSSFLPLISASSPKPHSPLVNRNRTFAGIRLGSNMSKEYKLKDLASVSLKPGGMQEVEVEGVEGGKVLLVNSAGSVKALGSKCTHYGAPLAKGILTESGRLTCPWHGGG